MKCDYVTSVHGRTIRVTAEGVFGFDKLREAVAAEVAAVGLTGEAAEATVEVAMWQARELSP